MKIQPMLWLAVALLIVLVPLTAFNLSSVVPKEVAATAPVTAPATVPVAEDQASSVLSSETQGQEAAADGDAAAAESSPAIYTGAPATFRILDETTGKIAEVAAKDYVRGAVAAEMPALYHPEALKAQAVAAYTYAVRTALDHRQTPLEGLKGADFSADPQNLQVYITEKQAQAFYGDDFDLYWTRVCEAADQAGRYLLLSDGEPIAAAYHAISAGQTEDAKNIWNGPLPCLTTVNSDGDILAAGYESQAVFTSKELGDALRTAYPDIQLPQDPAKWIVVEDRSGAGYVTQVAAGGVTMHGQQLRTLLGLRSTNFDLDVSGGTFTFTVRGYGHGAGLSQNGADYMARQGSTFDEILAHYYPGSQLALSAAS